MFLQGISIVFFVCNLFLQPKKNVQSSIISLLVFALQCNPCIQKLLSFRPPIAMDAYKNYSLSISSLQCMPPKSTLFPSPRNNPCLQKLLSFHPPCGNACFQKLLSFHLPAAIHASKKYSLSVPPVQFTMTKIHTLRVHQFFRRITFQK